MSDIVKNTIAKLTDNSYLDEIKTALKEECSKVTFEITDDEWHEMMNDILYGLA